MHQKAKKKHIGLKIFLFFLFVLLLAALAVMGYLGLRSYRKSAAEPPEAVYERFTASTSPAAAENAQWEQLFEAAQAQRRYEPGTAVEQSYTKSVMPFSLSYLDPDKLFQGLLDEAKALLAQEVQAASRSGEIYDEEFHYRDDVLDRVFESALEQRLGQAGDFLSSSQLELSFYLDRDHWELENTGELKSLISDSFYDWDAYVLPLRLELAESAEYIPLHYEIDEHALAGPKPDQSRFGSTEDASVIEALLASPPARQLMNGQTTAWSRDIALIPGTSIQYYLDETILVLVWQEEEARAVGTFSEVFIADGSQLRRKIAGDELWSMEFETASSFAVKTNSVLTFGGDMYHHGRENGIVVYDRGIARFEPYTSDICYITSDGDMLFTYREQMETQEQAQAFVDENDILFSLCFGPVLIDNGEDVTPWIYPWGEVQDTYARSALGMLGEHHYLTMNINCQLPDHYYLATLRQAADAMMEKGCIKAYALDGGQTATTVFNGKLINPVQFGWEKLISDVIYFASAVPR